MSWNPTHPDPAPFANGGEMGARIRAFDWAATPLGPMSGWPQSLRTALGIALESGFPMYIAWGPEFVQLYNDGYRPILGSTKHPALGLGTAETFREIWHIIGPMFRQVLQGTPTTVVDFLLPLDRHGFVEECYFVFSYSPIREPSGAVGGVLVTVTETTARVLGERRLHLSQALAERARGARTVAEACAQAVSALGDDNPDLPFAVLYRFDTGVPVVAGSVRVDASAVHPGTWPLHEVVRTGEPKLVDPPGGPGRALVLPVPEPGDAIGVLVAGVSPQLMLDEPYRRFLTLLASQVGAAIGSARVLEEARARAEALSALDRAKSTFFSNVSHEFRTPLTLVLGPLDAARSSPDRSLHGDDLDTAWRNATRLLKLVNAVLDFSRIEAGRMQARYQPTDLPALTADLTSAFRSAVERAGLALVVDCPPLDALVMVDPVMWEKIVLNLLSNAFKHTLEGEIRVRVARSGADVVLDVHDTGVGIRAEDLPRIFERFFRVETTTARTHEGTGIGLALVKELVGLHHGSVEVQSAPGEGTAVRVRIPTGGAHVPPRFGTEATSPPPGGRIRPYVEEALRWLPTPPRAGPARTRDPSIRILVADDNADMREYLSRILDRWHVDVVSDGLAAWDALHAQRYDLLILDVMMPHLGGFELLQRLRADAATRAVPVLVLSARAGEEARVEGLQEGADDYVVKPFSARELVARVETQLVRSRTRTLEAAQAIRLASVFENAPVGVAILRGADHRFEFQNRVYADLIGRRDAIGRPIRAVLPELEGQGIFELLDRVFTTGDPFVGRSVRVSLLRDGALRECFFDFVYQPLLDGDATVGITVVAFEVTELVRARRLAESANRAKDEFLAMLGHELRNPLAPIRTALQLMRLRGVQGADRERDVIERQVGHLVALVDDLLDVSRIARGKVHLTRVPVDLADAVAEAVEMTGPALEERRHTLTIDVPRGFEIDGDARRLAQIVSNLLSNAAKYSDPGGRIAVRARGAEGGVELVVTDTGVGIRPDMLPHVFELFAQERQTVDRSQGGLGLGLAIVRSLVEAHGGVVSAHSEGAGRGAEFRIRLPLAAGTSRRHAPLTWVETPPPSAGRVLVVDDNVDAATMLSEVLRGLGHVVRIAHDGPAAIATAEAFVPDLVLLDLGLPVMDGYEVARALRQSPTLAAVRIVAVSGYGREADRRRTRQAGFDDHLVKPVEPARLEQVLQLIPRG